MATKKKAKTPKTKKKAAKITKPKSLVQTLQAALDLFKDGKNWIQGQYDDGKGHFCAIGALQHIDGPFEDKAHELLEAVADKYTPQKDVVSYNDADGTKFSDVKKLFTKAIAAAKKAPNTQKRVAELEKQLKTVSKLREKAYEQAMALENKEDELRDEIADAELVA